MSNRLPPEILLEIFSYLDPIENRRELLSLCRVSRTFKILAQPLLFQTFTTECRRDCTCPRTNDLGSLSLFTQTVLPRPDLQNTVRQVYVQAGDVSESSDDRRGFLLTSARNMLHQELQRLDITDEIKRNYSRNILNGDLDSVLVVLFASTERIEILRVASTKLRLKGLLDVFDPDVAGLYFNLKHLNISFVSEGPELEFFEIGDIMHLFFLPFLEHLGVTHCIGEPSHLSGLELSLGRINLSSISLVDSCINKDTLESILNASKYVKSFKYTACSLLNEELESVPVNGDDIMQALQVHKKNLEILHIELDDTDLEIDDQNRHTKLDHFASFSNLQHLHTEQSCLSTSPELPESLNELILENCDEPIFELIVFLVKERKTRLKRLGVVYVQPLWSPCTSVLDIFPQFNKKELYDNEVYRERFKDSVEELESIALDGVGLLLFIACECYQECVRMLNREMGLFREDEESS